MQWAQATAEFREKPRNGHDRPQRTICGQAPPGKELRHMIPLGPKRVLSTQFLFKPAQAFAITDQFLRVSNSISEFDNGLRRLIRLCIRRERFPARQRQRDLIFREDWLAVECFAPDTCKRLVELRWAVVIFCVVVKPIDAALEERDGARYSSNDTSFVTARSIVIGSTLLFQRQRSQIQS